MSKDYSPYLSGFAHIRERTGEDGARLPMPEEFVVWAYRLFLDREPDNDVVVRDKVSTIKDSRQLREAFLNSEEFRVKNQEFAARFASAQQVREAMRVERITNQQALLEFFGHVQQTWSALGETEPHWSVLSADQFKQESLSEHLGEFYESGRREVETLKALLARNGLVLPEHGQCLEYGCGVGRVTRWLASVFAQVWGYDISASHLALARQYMNSEGVANAQFKHVSDLATIRNLPAVDFFYTMIVLQHNPPPIIELVLSSLMKALKPGGVGVFQVPTYRKGYEFDVERYLKMIGNPDTAKHIEMHLLPQATVFELISSAGCVPIEVFEDNWAGPGYISNTYVVKQSAATAP